MTDFNGLVAIVTGGASGIGAATAELLGQRGAAVAVLDRDIATLPTQPALALQCDVTATAVVDHAVGAVADRLGAIDILVNNAGISAFADISALTETVFDSTFDTNVKGVLFVTQHALPLMPDGGRIVNVSSMVSDNAYPGSVAYAASKAAVDSITLSLAAGLGGRGITVNAVAPGATRTDFLAALNDNPERMAALEDGAALGRIGEPEDIARIVVFLASDDAGWITGERIRASGGMHL
jgi:NAD(P)-dependent dehydrogenase (short-subunit alcohol dehydrogenase family)